MTRRTGKLVPWYHVVMEPCDITTARGTACTFSGSYQAESKAEGVRDLAVCKVHGDILALDGWKVRKRKPNNFDLRNRRATLVRS